MEHKLLILITSNLSSFFHGWFFWYEVSKVPYLALGLKGFLLSLSQNSGALHFTLKAVIHSELIFFQGEVSTKVHFFHLSRGRQLLQYHLFKKLSFLHQTAYAALSSPSSPCALQPCSSFFSSSNPTSPSHPKASAHTVLSP